MKNRLEIAKELLRDDGVIFVQIDDNEQAYLKVLMDEIFGRDNFVCNNIIKTSVSGGFKINANKPVRVKEYILMFAKNKDFYTYFRSYTPNKRDKWDMHNNLYYDIKSNTIHRLEDILKEKNIINSLDRLKDIELNNSKFKDFYISHMDNICSTSYYKESEEKELSLLKKDEVIKYNNIFLYNGRMLLFLKSSLRKINNDYIFAQALSDLWDDIEFNNIQNEVKEAGFAQGKKPEKLLQRIIEISTKEGDLVLDFFAGSGTTLAVAHKMQRQYIGIEQMDYIEDITSLRLQKVIAGEQGGISKVVNWQGGGSFIYLELAKYNYNYIDLINNTSTTQELLNLFNTTIATQSLLNYDFDFSMFTTTEQDFLNLDLKDAKDFLIKSLNPNMLYIPNFLKDDTTYQLTKEDIKTTKSFYKEKID